MIHKTLWGKRNTFPDTEPASTLPIVPPGEESAYADTAPSPLAGLGPLRPPDDPLELALAVARKNNRVCPQPWRWEEFHQLLLTYADGGTLPAEPLLGEAWAATPALAKRMCLREQIDWALAHNCITPAYLYLRDLPDSDWNYLG